MRREMIIVGDAVVDAIVGYRTWKAYPDEGVVTLGSTTRSVPWPLHETMASECLCNGVSRSMSAYLMDREHGHTCGIHAYSEPVIPYAPSLVVFKAAPGFMYVTGEVYMWGTVRRHKWGYRSQYARVAALYTAETIDPSTAAIIDLAALQYGVPVVLVSNDPRMCNRLTLQGGVLKSQRRVASDLGDLARRRYTEGL